MRRQKKRSRKRESKKEAVKNLRAVLKKYPHWQWDGDIKEVKVDDFSYTEIYVKEDDDTLFSVVFYADEKSGKKEFDFEAIFLEVPLSPEPLWEDLSDGQKGLKITARLKGGLAFDTKVYSKMVYMYLFKPGEVVTARDGTRFDPTQAIFDSDEIYIDYPATYLSRDIADGGFRQSVTFPIKGLSEIKAAVIDLLIL